MLESVEGSENNENPETLGKIILNIRTPSNLRSELRPETVQTVTSPSHNFTSI